MKNELSYLLITPYTLSKSRTGGVMARLLSRTDLEFAGALNYKNINIESITGETIRDTYADLVMSPGNIDEVQYFEPAVLTPGTKENAEINLKIFADFLKNEQAIVENMNYKDPSKIERTLVIIKPDNWKYASSRPGTIIDMFSRTGLRLIGCKIQQMSVAQGLEFYGSVKDVLVEKLGPVFGKKGKSVLENEFDIKLSDESLKMITDSFGAEYAIDQFNQIIEFMAGTKPPECPKDELEKPGKVKSMVLIYEGVDAVNKIRDVLGPTDPTKAPGGTIRREFGSNIMVNTAHASDSAENCRREMGIVRIMDNNCYTLMEDYLSSVGN